MRKKYLHYLIYD